MKRSTLGGSLNVAMFDHILLEPDQEDLLVHLVEATRAVDRGARRPFYTNATVGSSLVALSHPGLGRGTEFRVYAGDIEELGKQGLLNVTYQQHSLKFDVSPLGFRYYEELRHRAGEPAQRVVAEMRHHIDSQSFRFRCPAAYDKWQTAESLLWGADSTEQSTAIGHHCREALQDCVHALTLERDSSASAEDKPKIVARAKALLASERVHLGEPVSAYLDALLAYWGTMCDLVQRQEHGAAKEGQPLVWEDARRVVVGTLIVMTEFASAIHPPQHKGAT